MREEEHNPGRNDRVAGMLQKPFRNYYTWALGQGAVSAIFPWEMIGLDTGLQFASPRHG